MERIYLDHAATTPLDPRVLEAMLPYLKGDFGNASSVHALGRRARFAVEASRERVAAYLGAEPGEILFTSGGTEADNTALLGLRTPARPGLVTSRAEHEAVLRPAERLAATGVPVLFLDPRHTGAVDAPAVAGALDGRTGLVSLLYVNNEVGTCTPVRDIAALCRREGVLFHCDAVQAAGVFSLNVDDLGVDALTLSGHKIYGPKGVGVLYVRGGVSLRPFIEGGAQERKRRAGTENVAAIVGLARAVDLLEAERTARVAHLSALRRRLVQGLRECLDEGFILNTPLGDGASAPHLINIAFPPVDGVPVDGEMLLLNLDLAGVCASAGSACTSGTLTPSHVLLAMGLDPATASATLRFSLGKDNTEEEVDRTVEVVRTVVRRMKQVLT